MPHFVCPIRSPHEDRPIKVLGRLAMVAMLVLAATLTGQMPKDGPHVRTTEHKVTSLIDLGLAESPTFRQLVDQLNASDVIVYVALKQTGDDLGAYLAHDIVVAGGRRYLHVAIDTFGTDRHIVARLGHELQHALEVAQAPDVRDAAGLKRLFTGLDIREYCRGCLETAAALRVQAAIDSELARRPMGRKGP
jgi:hypothetical protein